MSQLRNLSLGLLALGVTSTLCTAQVFRPLGNLGGSSSQGAGAANTGLAAVTAEDGSFESRAAVFTPPTLTGVGTLGGAFSEAGDLSADGLVLVGGAVNSQRRERPFRWTAASGIQDLGALPGGSPGFATSTDAAGQVVAGWSTNSSAQTLAFRWTSATGMIGLGTLGGTTSMALGVSGDGSTVVGFARTALGETHAFRHTAAAGLQDLGTLPSGTYSQAEAANVDGSVIVGSATENGGSGSRAFRWTSTTGMVSLGVIGEGLSSSALDVSADGARVVGEAGTEQGSRAFLWTAAAGMQDLNVLYSSVIPAGWVLYRAESISANGRSIVGTGFNPDGGQEAWLLDTAVVCRGDFNQSGAASVQDIFDFLSAYFSGNPAADVNASGSISVQDIFDFLAAYFAGCP